MEKNRRQPCRIDRQNQQMASDYNTVNQRLDAIENDLKVTNNPAFNRVLLRGTPNAPALWLPCTGMKKRKKST
jgi:hypothetical protein